MIAGERNAGPLLPECAETLCDDWWGGSRDAYHLMRAQHYTESVLAVLRQRGMLNDAGVSACIAEIGPLEVKP